MLRSERRVQKCACALRSSPAGLQFSKFPGTLGFDAQLFSGRRIAAEPFQDCRCDDFWGLYGFGFFAWEGERAHARPGRARIDDVNLEPASIFGLVGISAEQSFKGRLGRSVRAPKCARFAAD